MYEGSIRRVHPESGHTRITVSTRSSAWSQTLADGLHTDEVFSRISLLVAGERTRLGLSRSITVTASAFDSDEWMSATLEPFDFVLRWAEFFTPDPPFSDES